jgi:hypothetical protein
MRSHERVFELLTGVWMGLTLKSTGPPEAGYNCS